MKKITIIGGGATGILLAINLIKHQKNELTEINLVEKKEKVGRGVAYSTATNFHLLNVPANKMGAFPDDLEHFYRWLTAQGYEYFASDFVPRKIYGDYLRANFAETLKNKAPNITINVFDDEATDVLVDDRQAQVILDSGEILYSDKVILAFGNFLPPHPKSESQSFTDSEKYFQNPWNARNFDKIQKSDNVLILGTGLTAVDTVLSLQNNQHTGKITLFSTRGLLPAVHELGFVYPSFGEELNGQIKITELFKIVRRHIKNAEKQNSNWRAVIDSLRPHTQKIWLDLPIAEKRYFMQHLSRYWNVARHRMPPECAEILNDMLAKNQLEILNGRLKNIELNKDGRFDVRFSTANQENNLTADVIFNCIGSESDFSKINSTLVKNLVGKGLIKPDVLKFGIDAKPDGRTIDKNGKISDKIYTIGTALKGILWESTAMPEIRSQAHNLAMSLIDGG